jgi:hypothetical protein
MHAVRPGPAVNVGAEARCCTGVYNVIAPSLVGALGKRRSTQAGPDSSSPISTHVLCCTQTHASLLSFTIARATHCDSHRSAIPCLLQE